MPAAAAGHDTAVLSAVGGVADTDAEGIGVIAGEGGRAPLDPVGAVLPLILQIAARGGHGEVDVAGGRRLIFGLGGDGHGTGVVVVGVDGILGGELAGEIGVSGGVVVKELVTQQEVIVIIIARVPGGVHAVIIVADVDDVPAVGTAPAVTADITGIHAQRQGQTVKQAGVALTDRCAVHEGGVGGVFEGVIVVVQVGVVVGDVVANVVVDDVRLFVVGAIENVVLGFPLVDQPFNGGVHLRFLRGGGVIFKGEGHGQTAVGIVPGVAPAAPMAFKIVALGGYARMGEAVVDHGAAVHVGLVLADVAVADEVDGKGLPAGFQLVADIGRCLRRGID